jgi:hypothetical protein
MPHKTTLFKSIINLLNRKGKYMKKLKIGLHGEAIITSINKLPEGAVKQPHTGDLIIAASETVGNHHRIFCEEKEASLYERDGILYLKVESPVGVVCADKHDQAVLDPGVYQIGVQREWDYLEQMERSVAD